MILQATGSGEAGEMICSSAVALHIQHHNTGVCPPLTW